MKDTAISLEVERREEELEKRRRELEEKEKSLMATEVAVESGEFKEYVEHEMIRYEKPNMPRVKDASEIYSMIEDARELVSMGRLNDARAIYSKIGNVYEHLDISPVDKKRVYYAVLELKTDIELAHLA